MFWPTGYALKWSIERGTNPSRNAPGSKVICQPLQNTSSLASTVLSGQSNRNNVLKEEVRPPISPLPNNTHVIWQVQSCLAPRISCVLGVEVFQPNSNTVQLSTACVSADVSQTAGSILPCTSTFHESPQHVCVCAFNNNTPGKAGERVSNSRRSSREICRVREILECERVCESRRAVRESSSKTTAAPRGSRGA